MDGRDEPGHDGARLALRITTRASRPISLGGAGLRVFPRVPIHKRRACSRGRTHAHLRRASAHLRQRPCDASDGRAITTEDRRVHGRAHSLRNAGSRASGSGHVGHTCTGQRDGRAPAWSVGRCRCRRTALSKSLTSCHRAPRPAPAQCHCAVVAARLRSGETNPSGSVAGFTLAERTRADRFLAERTRGPTAAIGIAAIGVLAKRTQAGRFLAERTRGPDAATRIPAIAILAERTRTGRFLAKRTRGQHTAPGIPATAILAERTRADRLLAERTRPERSLAKRTREPSAAVGVPPVASLAERTRADQLLAERTRGARRGSRVGRQAASCPHPSGGSAALTPPATSHPPAPGRARSARRDSPRSAAAPRLSR